MWNMEPGCGIWSLGVEYAWSLGVESALEPGCGICMGAWVWDMEPGCGICMKPGCGICMEPRCGIWSLGVESGAWVWNMHGAWVWNLHWSLGVESAWEPGCGIWSLGVESGARVWNLEPGCGIWSLGVESGAWVWNMEPTYYERYPSIACHMHPCHPIISCLESRVHMAFSLLEYKCLSTRECFHGNTVKAGDVHTKYASGTHQVQEKV